MMQISFFQKIRLLYKNVLVSIGSILIAVSILLLPVLSGSSDFTAFEYDFNETKETIGIIEAVEGTGYEINETTVNRVYYTFTIDSTLESFKGVSYATYVTFMPNDETTVEYIVDNPYVSRIKGMSNAPFGWWFGTIFLIFPLIGIILFVIPLGSWRRKLKILKNGILSRGVLIKSEATNVEVNSQTVYKLTFKYVVGGKTYHTIVRTHNHQVLRDEPQERLVYHRKKPELAFLLDELPKSLKEKVLKGLPAANAK